MTPEKVLETIEIYRSFFEKAQIPKHEYPLDRPYPQYVDQAAHCHNMLDQMVGFVETGDLEKAFRWLGFIQGFLWCTGQYTIDDMRDHNR